MGLWDFFKPSGRSGMVRTPLTSSEARVIGRTMEFRREWTCRCGAQLKIRAREDRSSGPSNFRPYPAGHPSAGHSQVKSSELTWNGLAEERGWKTDPVECPACQRGLSRAEFKDRKRAGAL